MLGAHPIYPVLLATDLAVTREFYHDRLGLEILNENEDALTFGCGAGTQFSVTKSTVGTADGRRRCRGMSPTYVLRSPSSDHAGSRSKITTCLASRPRMELQTSSSRGQLGSSIRARTL